MEPTADYKHSGDPPDWPSSGMTPSAFLTALWGDPPPGVINIWRLPDRTSSWHRELGGINNFLRRFAMEEVYTGVALADPQKGRFTTRNRIEEAAAIAGVWADIDVFHEVHTKAPRLPGTREEAREVMAQLPHEPTIIVDSGHGLQYWWLLTKPWVFAGEEEWGQARRMVQWWHKLTKDLMETRGWTTDSVYDLGRILRIPGTFNNKVRDDRKEVVAIKTDGPRYSIRDFMELVPEDFEATLPAPEQRRNTGNSRASQQNQTSSTTSSGLTLDPAAEPGAVRLQSLLKADKKFQRTWEKNRPDLKDQSASSYNMSLADIAVRAGWDDQEVVNLMICWRRRHGCDLKLREDYYARTLKRAQELRESKKSEDPRHVSNNGQQPGSGRETPVDDPFTAEDSRPILILTKDEGRNVAACMRAIAAANQPPTLFSLPEARGICVVSTPDVHVCSPTETHLEVAQSVRFQQFGQKNQLVGAVPTVVLMKLVHFALRRHLPQFNGLKRIPILWDGELWCKPGYHPESGYFIDPPADLDTGLSVEEALRILDDYLGEFPFETPADRTNAYSVVLGAPLKTLGNAPGLFCDKPASQTGASLLCRCIAWIVDGRTPSVVTQGKSMGELDKRVITKLKNQPAAIIFDNVTKVLDSEMVVSGMTDDHFGSRLLNLNEDALVLTKALSLMFTGNNLKGNRDLLNRCLRCRLDANCPMPEARTGFRHVLPDAVVNNRAILVSAVASVVQRWVEAGIPQGNETLGSFGAYTRAVSGLMTFAGMHEFDGNRKRMLGEAIAAGEDVWSFVCRWWDKHGSDTVSAAELVPLAEELDLKGDDGNRRATSLSNKLGDINGQVFEAEDGVIVKVQQSGRDASGRAKRGLKYRLIKQ